MKRWHLAVLIACLFIAVCTFAADRSANAYKTHKLSRNSVLFTCEDEHEPKIKKLDNTTMVIISCEQ